MLHFNLSLFYKAFLRFLNRNSWIYYFCYDVYQFVATSLFTYKHIHGKDCTKVKAWQWRTNTIPSSNFCLFAIASDNYVAQNTQGCSFESLGQLKANWSQMRFWLIREPFSCVKRKGSGFCYPRFFFLNNKWNAIWIAETSECWSFKDIGNFPKSKFEKHQGVLCFYHYSKAFLAVCLATHSATCSH